MKILFYFNSMTPAGGIERVIATLANKFVQFMDVTILVKDKAYSHYPLDERVKIISLDNEIKFNMYSKLDRAFEAGKNFIGSQKDRKSTRLNSSHEFVSRMPSSA